MSDTTVGHPPGLVDGVAAYVREVRAELADLPAEDVDDLTGGMEADLTELAADCGGDLAGRLGSPGLYAAELRAAAGLPERVAGPARRRHRSLSEQAALDRASFTRLVGRHPWLRSVTAFLVTLRPAWWVLRGYLAAWALWSLVMGMSGIGLHGFLHLALALGAIVVSVRLGQGWLRHLAMTRPLLVLGNTVAVVVALVASTAGVTSGEANYAAQEVGSPPGVALDGAQVSNIYAYGSDGQRLTGVRLFAGDGRPLNGAQSSIDSNGNPIGLDVNGNQMAVVRDSSGAQLLNVYPQMLFGPDPWQVTDPTSPSYAAASLPPWTPPVSINPLVPSATPSPTSTATPTMPTPAATPTAPATAPTAKPTSLRPPLPTPPSGPSPAVTRSGR